jgi:hypothetical protein
MHPDRHFADVRLSQPDVNVADPLEIARWSWLLDVTDAEVKRAVTLVGNNGGAVSHYIESFLRPGKLRH